MSAILLVILYHWSSDDHSLQNGQNSRKTSASFENQEQAQMKRAYEYSSDWTISPLRTSYYARRRTRGSQKCAGQTKGMSNTWSVHESLFLRMHVEVVATITICVLQRTVGFLTGELARVVVVKTKNFTVCFTYQEVKLKYQNIKERLFDKHFLFGELQLAKE